jgi:hypothetical protein
LQVQGAVLETEAALTRLGLVPDPPILAVQGEPQRQLAVNELRHWLLATRRGQTDGWAVEAGGPWGLCIGQTVLPSVPGSLEKLRLIVETLQAATLGQPSCQASGAKGRRAKGGGRDKNLEARDKWIYRQCCDLRKTLGQIVVELGRIAGEKGWRKISRIQGIRSAAFRYAKRHGLDAPPPRQNF